MFRRIYAYFLMSLSWSLNASANPVLGDRLQIGSTWGSRSFDVKSPELHSEGAKKGMRARVRVNNGQGVLVGFSGQDAIIFTAHHVAYQGFAWSKNRRYRFPVQKTSCRGHVVTAIEELDFAVVRCVFSSREEYEKVATDAVTISWNGVLPNGFIPIGSPRSLTMIEILSRSFQEDSDCKIFLWNSASPWIRHGCDVTIGDSGGPILDRETGVLLGIQSQVGTLITRWRMDSQEIEARWSSGRQRDVLHVLAFATNLTRAGALLLKDPKLPLDIRESLFPPF